MCTERPSKRQEQSLSWAAGHACLRAGVVSSFFCFFRARRVAKAARASRVVLFVLIYIYTTAVMLAFLGVLFWVFVWGAGAQPALQTKRPKQETSCYSRTNSCQVTIQTRDRSPICEARSLPNSATCIAIRVSGETNLRTGHSSFSQRIDSRCVGRIEPPDDRQRARALAYIVSSIENLPFLVCANATKMRKLTVFGNVTQQTEWTPETRETDSLQLGCSL